MTHKLQLLSKFEKSNFDLLES